MQTPAQQLVAAKASSASVTWLIRAAMLTALATSIATTTLVATGGAGSDGRIGVDGAVGPTGPAGPVGPQGERGPNGTDAAVCPPCTDGVDAEDGAEGPQGPAGADGASIDTYEGYFPTTISTGACYSFNNHSTLFVCKEGSDVVFYRDNVERMKFTPDTVQVMNPGQLTIGHSASSGATFDWTTPGGGKIETDANNDFKFTMGDWDIFEYTNVDHIIFDAYNGTNGTMYLAGDVDFDRLYAYKGVQLPDSDLLDRLYQKPNPPTHPCSCTVGATSFDMPCGWQAFGALFTLEAYAVDFTTPALPRHVVNCTIPDVPPEATLSEGQIVGTSFTGNDSSSFIGEFTAELITPQQLVIKTGDFGADGAFPENTNFFLYGFDIRAVLEWPA